jgi:hypothetical protein
MRDRRAIGLFVATIAVVGTVLYAALWTFTASVPGPDAQRAIGHLDRITERVPPLHAVITRGDESADFAIAAAIVVIAMVSGLSLVARYRRQILLAVSASTARFSPRLGRFLEPRTRETSRNLTVSQVLALAFEQRSVRACFVLLGALAVSLLAWRFIPSGPATITTCVAVCVLHIALYLRQGNLRTRVEGGLFASNEHEVREFLEFVLSQHDRTDDTSGGRRRALVDVPPATAGYANDTATGA